MDTALTLSNGCKLPMVGFGTYKVGKVPTSTSRPCDAGRDAKAVLKDALNAGYRLIDCAEYYLNEKEVGEAIQESGIPRSDLFVTSKVWNATLYNGAAAVKAQVECSLKDLGLEYLDLYLVHWPVPGKHVDAYKALEELLDAGKIRGIGVSNYTIEDYELLKQSMRYKPLVNQFEISPYVFRPRTIEYFQKEGIVVQAYRTLHQGIGLDNPFFQELSRKYGVSVAQILGRWCIQKGIVFIAKTERLDRMKMNLELFHFALTPEESARLDALTNDKTIEEFKAKYADCIVRDTPLQVPGFIRG